MSDENKISYSVIAGELRKSARLYDVFKHASEAADLLANFERELKGMEKEREQLSKECLELDSRCDATIEKHKAVLQEIEVAKNTKEDILNKAKEDAILIVNTAKDKALIEEKRAEEKLKGIQNLIDKAQEQAHTANTRKGEAEAACAKAEEELKKIKERFLKVVG